MGNNIAWLLAAISLCGCGYTAGSLTPYGIKTVAVPIFQNDTLYRGYEFLLTKAIITEIATRTSLHPTARDAAETMLVGNITSIRQSTVIKDENRQATQFDVTIAVNILWTDTRTGKPIVPAQTLAETVQVTTDRGENFENALIQALRKLARSIVYTLESPYLLTDMASEK